MFGIDPSDLIIIIGVGFILLGIAARMGYWKKWYWGTRGGAYAYLPAGLVFILYTYDGYFKESLGSYYFLYWVAIILLVGCCIWWAIRPPAFIKPDWVRWIEKHPRQVKNAMAAEVEAGKAWEDYIISEDAVDQWAKSLKGKPPKKKRN